MPLSLRDQLDDADERVGVAELRVDAHGVGLRDQAPLVELHGEGHGVARGHGVEPELVADLVRLHDGPEIRDAAVRPEESHGLELGPGPRAGVRPVLHDAHLAARHRAPVAGVVLLEVPLLHGVRVDLVDVLEGGGLEVARGQAAEGVEHLEVLRGAELRVVGPRGLQFRHRGLADGGDLVGVRQRDLPGALHDDALEVLGAHHRAGAAPAEGALVHVDVGDPHEPFTRGADGHGAGLRFAEGRPHLLQRLRGGESLPGGRVVELEDPVLHREPGEPLRLPLHDDPVESRLLQLRPEVAAAVRAQVHPGLGRLGGRAGTWSSTPAPCPSGGPS